jgi:hypothetical protein
MTDKEIMAKYKFFKPELPPTENLMCFGFECEEGWFDLIDKTCEKILATNPPEDFLMFQVKEKFATLRIYTNHSTMEIDNIIDEAERISSETCETCGAKGKITGEYWVKTLCEKCEK